MYLRTRYEDSLISISLLTSRARVAPLKKVIIPWLELCGAVLTAKLLRTSVEDLGLSTNKLFAWTNSMIVYAWVSSTTSCLKLFVANHVQETTDLIPSSQWQYMPTGDNLAYLESYLTGYWNKTCGGRALFGFPTSRHLATSTVQKASTRPTRHLFLDGYM